ncbi:PREDICTED: putative odorant receptor 92a [Dufourea novaeangliae]|uniref:putative odorant receptor 92a n=1 Tax=Dufourea novaeangliae TaxID=178035 RepID=UPI000767BCB9|nr:PREDICTED: putative odorant receptor 92a [Dufourea novaeangliae]
MTDARNPPSYRNVHYKVDTEYTVQVAKNLLTPLGVWPLHRGDLFLDNVKSFVHIGTIFSLMCFLLIPHIIYTYHDVEDLTRYMKVIAAQVFSFLAIAKFWTMVINKKDIRFCLTEMEAHYRDVECEEDRLVMKNSAKVGRFFTTLYLGLAYGGALPYHIILPLMSERIVKADNTTQIPLPYLSNYIFFVIEDSPIYEITFVSQIVISSIILSTNCGIYSLIATIAMHSCGLFVVVGRQLDTLLEYKQDKLYDRLRNIILHHLKAIEFADTIEMALSTVFLLEMVGCTIIICFLEYGVIMEWEDHKILSMMTYVVLMTSIFVNVFIICFIGDCLKQESEKVGETSYLLSWYDLPEDIIKSLKMIIVRTSRPANLSASKLFELSLQAFCDVCKTSAAYLNFLRTMTS